MLWLMIKLYDWQELRNSQKMWQRALTSVKKIGLVGDFNARVESNKKTMLQDNDWKANK